MLKAEPLSAKDHVASKKQGERMCAVGSHSGFFFKTISVTRNTLLCYIPKNPKTAQRILLHRPCHWISSPSQYQQPMTLRPNHLHETHVLFKLWCFPNCHGLKMVRILPAGNWKSSCRHNSGSKVPIDILDPCVSWKPGKSKGLLIISVGWLASLINKN